ncbi:hypothetical protein VU661_24955, partial [Enterobacter kobei]
SGNWTWSDIVFLDHDPAVFWNAEIITANVAFTDAVEEATFRDIRRQLVLPTGANYSGRIH